jgi:transketolase
MMTSTPYDGDYFPHRIANTIRGLSMDAVQQANSGHPGAPMGLADVATVLITRFLKVCPSRPDWPDRDRLVLSAGHASMLLYSSLFLMGYPISIEDLRNFRQWGSITPGHPEVHVTPGVEVTTGPLGQGIATAVGLALAEEMMAARFNRGDAKIVDHFTYVIASDGDMMEGVQAEAVSLAGHLALGKLIVYYDSNGITIDGKTGLCFSEDVAARFFACGWQVQQVDGHDQEAIEAAIVVAREHESQPSLIVGRSHIGYGSPGKQDSSQAHGAPLGEQEILAAKKSLCIPVEPKFFVAEDIYDFFARRRAVLEQEAAWWDRKLADFKREDPGLFADWQSAMNGDLPAELALPVFEAGTKVATRKASHDSILRIAGAVPYLVGGSADLAGSNLTDFADGDLVAAGHYDARTIRFGIREHAMAAMANGMALHGGLRPFAATFLVFSDYMRPSMRLAALMELPVIYVFTHDSIFVGEDGPTHQPIEHLAALRAIPNLAVIRPAEATETAAAWEAALRRKTGPTAIVLTRQGLPVIDRTVMPPASEVSRGGYVLLGAEVDPEIILMASGSEVWLVVEAGRKLIAGGVRARVVSFPCLEFFQEQDQAWRDAVLPPTCTKRLAVEAGLRLSFDRYLGLSGRFIGMDRFGASAPAEENAKRFGFTVENVLEVARQVLR